MNEKKFALLIDADNTSYNYIDTIISELTNEGIITYKRIYGDWTNSCLENWKEKMLENSILPIQQYSYTQGKNSTDSAMIIDAMDILYSGNVDGFCLVTSDSDFTRLAARLRESGMEVIGMGRIQTPKPFVSACNQFKYLDLISNNENKQDEQEAHQQKESKDSKRKIKQSEPSLKPENTKGNEEPNEITANSPLNTNVKKMIEDAIRECVGDSDNEWVLVSNLGSLLKKRHSDFDCRNYGHSKMTSLLEANGFILNKFYNPKNKINPNSYDCYVKLKF